MMTCPLSLYRPHACRTVDKPVDLPPTSPPYRLSYCDDWSYAISMPWLLARSALERHGHGRASLDCGLHLPRTGTDRASPTQAPRPLNTVDLCDCPAVKKGRSCARTVSDVADAAKMHDGRHNHNMSILTRHYRLFH